MTEEMIHLPLKAKPISIGFPKGQNFKPISSRYNQRLSLKSNVKITSEILREALYIVSVSCYVRIEKYSNELGIFWRQRLVFAVTTKA